MDKYFINTGTVTKASKGRDILRKNGINAYVQAAKGNLSSTGCGFGIIVNAAALERARHLLQNAGIAVMGVSPAKN